MATETQKLNLDSESAAAPSEQADPIMDKSSAEGGGSGSGEGEAKSGDSLAVDNSEPVSIAQKKIKRAERFGMPVQFSEEEKRNSRAERFGTGSGASTGGKEAARTSAEDQKRKARAERFGLPAQSIPADEEAKKKARLAKFTPATKTDTVEEDKRKARAARFSEAKASSLSHVNGGGNIEIKAAVAGKAGEGA